MGQSVLEYLKTSVTKTKEYYHIPLTNTELLYLQNEDVKVLTKLSDSKLLVAFEGELTEEEELECSPFCLKLHKKGYLSNIEKRELIKQDANVQVDEIQSVLKLYTNGLKARDLNALQGIFSEVLVDDTKDLDEDLDESDREKIASALATAKDLNIDSKKKLEIADTFSKDKALLSAFFKGNKDSENMETVIERVHKFFSLRVEGIKFNIKEISNFPMSLLQKISLFIDYENSGWDLKVVPKSLQRFIS